ncbi:hypothetical protein J3458_006933 [Metarhizium acridum]|uniref:uncharacterized protein n=1 Tax=Metarhizium acridum TaxID=92637 RepID=UPI001C6C3A34|nr:hypothetical protein J3458_006933 [Metarhizium acridum]
MVMLPLLVSGLMASVSVAGPMEIRGVEHHCATRSISPEERELFTRQSNQPDDGQEINLGCVLHFCCGQGGECPPDSVAEKTVEDMNELFAGGKIRFNLQNVSRINDPRCTAGVTDNRSMDQLKSQVHQGNTSTLNVVYVPTNQGAGVKGMCVVPQPGMDIAAGIGGADGCVVAMDTLPKDNGGNGGNADNGGNGRPGGNTGNAGGSGRPGGPFSRLFSRQGLGGGDAHLSGALITTIHETGHWLGENHVGGGFQGGFSRRQGGGSTGNVMEPVSMPNKQYSFSQDQFQRMRRMAFARVNAQKAPVGDNNRPPFGNGGDGGDNTGRPGKPGRPTQPGPNPGSNPGPGSDRPGQNPQRPSQPTPLPGDDGQDFPGGNGFPGGNNPGFPGGNNPGFPGGNNPGSPGGNNPGSPGGNNPGSPGGNNPGFPGGNDPAPGGIDPQVWEIINQVYGADTSGLEIHRIGARAEPEAEADESGLVHIARREGTEGEADESGLVHIARRDDAGEPDFSGLVHIARK